LCGSPSSLWTTSTHETLKASVTALAAAASSGSTVSLLAALSLCLSFFLLGDGLRVGLREREGEGAGDAVGLLGLRLPRGTAGLGQTHESLLGEPLVKVAAEGLMRIDWPGS